MIAAADVDAIARGDFIAVLGEMHLAQLTIINGAFVPQHPEPAELLDALRRDLGGERVAFVASKQWPKTTLRTAPLLIQPDDLALETGFDPSALPRDRTLCAADLDVVPRGDRLIVRSRDGRFERELVDFVAIQLSYAVQSAFRMLAAAPHTPRVTIDRLVVSRETWCVPASSLGFARERDAPKRLLSARRWARDLGLPRHVYVKAASEVKPIFIDLDSPVSVDMLSRLSRRAASSESVPGEAGVGRPIEAQQLLRISEMLPALDEAWLPGLPGDTHTCELRIVARDPVAACRHGQEKAD
jgi:hypothetical protein